MTDSDRIAASTLAAIQSPREPFGGPGTEVQCRCGDAIYVEPGEDPNDALCASCVAEDEEDARVTTYTSLEQLEERKPMNMEAFFRANYTPSAGVPRNTLTLGEKLDPRRFTAMSEKMAAILSFVLGDEAVYRTDPAIAELIITSDRLVLARHAGEVGADWIIGDYADFTANLARLMVVAGLDIVEAERFISLCRRKVQGLSRLEAVLQ